MPMILLLHINSNIPIRAKAVTNNDLIKLEEVF